MKTVNIGIAIAAAFAMSACSTIITGTTETVAINTTPVDASCGVQQGEKRIGTFSTPPREFKVDKTRDDLVVTCNKVGYSEVRQINESAIEPWTFGNILLGGIIGFVVDLASGATNKYEKQMSITLPVETGSAPTMPKNNSPSASAKPSS